MIKYLNRLKRQNPLISTFYKLKIYPGLFEAFFYKKRLANLMLSRIGLAFKSNRAMAMPYNIIIEPVCGCNLKCPMCPVGTGKLKRKRGVMKFSTFKKIIDELSPYTIFIYLTNWGEPMLNGQIFEFIKYAKKKKMFILMSSNASILSRSNVDGLISSGLDAIKVSLDGASEKTYSNARRGGDFEKVLGNIKLLSAEKSRLVSKRPYVNLQFIVMKHNEHEIEKMRQMAKSLSVDRLSFKTVRVDDEDQAKKFLPENKKYWRYDSGSESCTVPWESAVIAYDGSVTMCCNDAEMVCNMGNITKESFRKIWNNEKYAKLREQIREDKNNIPICRACVGSKSRFLE